MEKQVKNHIQIEGIMLSPEAIKALTGFQEHENEELNFITRSINEAVCIIVELETEYGADFDQNYPEAREIVRSLVFARKQLSHLKKH